MNRPIVSVCLATHDGDIHLAPRALNSIVAQDLGIENLEVIVGYDGVPSIQAHRTLNAFADENPDLRMMIVWPHDNRKTGYYCVSRNRALPICRAPYIANLDADNEWLPAHLSGLLKTLQTPDPNKHTFPHFAYSRRRYVKDLGCEDPSGKLPEGDSELIPWNAENVTKLNISPQYNFVDTSDFLIGKGTLYELAERTGCVWDSGLRRFGDWDLMRRISQVGFFGAAVDQVTHVYHWTGNNLQTERFLEDVMAIPESVYLKLKAEGVIVDDA